MKFLFIRVGYSVQAEVSPPLGLLYLAAVLRDRFGTECLVLDPIIEPMSDDELLRRTRAFNPDYIGVTAFSFQSSAVARLTASLRAAVPRAFIIAGGAYATTQPAEALAGGGIDACVIGEGEAILPRLIEARQNGTPLSDVRGIAFVSGGEVVVTPPAEAIMDLDSLPLPDYSLTDVDALERMAAVGTLRKHSRFFTMFTSRGCPYLCSFCHPIFGKKFRPRSAENVLKEVDILRGDLGIREIQIPDDAFNLLKPRAMEICRGLVERGSPVALSFPSGLRSDLLDEELIDWMVRAGTYKAGIAIETASPRIQREIGKNLNLQNATKSIDAFVKRHVITNGFFLFGFPGETLEDMRETMRFASRSRLHTAVFFFVQPLPGSRLHEQYKQAGREPLPKEGLSSFFNLQMVKYVLSEADPAGMMRNMKTGWIRFYADPFRIYRILRDVPDKKRLVRLALIVLVRVLVPRLERYLVPKRLVTLLRPSRAENFE